MITVRFPTGLAIQYNDANFVTRHVDYSDLLTQKDGKWVAQVPNSAVIEVVRPCSVYWTSTPEDADWRGLVNKDIRGLRRDIQALAKKK